MKCEYAIVSVDMHRGHLDPTVATLPLLPEGRCTKVIESTEEFFNNARELGIPIIHVVTMYRNSEEIITNPHWNENNQLPSGTRKGIDRHNLIGEPTTEIIPSLYKDGDLIVNTKKRYSCFLHTELEFLLNQIEAKTVILTGINTSSCVLCTAFEATNKDYKVYVINDCVDSMDGREFHDSALMIIDRIIGKTVSSEEMISILKKGE